VRGFAEQFINWSWQTLRARQLQLARVAVGEARSSMLLAAQSTTRDYELRRSKTTNNGRVIAVATYEPARPGLFVVVTLEKASSSTGDYQGLKASYHLTLARAVQRTPNRWAITSWQPQN
jgi:hypothetical protein